MARPRHISDDEVLAEARACFLEHGPAVSTSHIAAEVGLSQAALFKRFHTKENLMLLALMPEPNPAWFQRVERGVTAEPISDQLVQIGTLALIFLKRMVPAVMVLKSAGLDPEVMLRRMAEPPPVRGRRLLTTWFTQALAEGRIGAAEPHHLAMHFMGGLHIRAFMSHMFDTSTAPEDDAAYVQHFVTTLWRGIAPEEDSP